jgi:hypothetical protein
MTQMPRSPDSAQFDLAEVFYSVQEQMLAQLAVGAFFEHPTASGSSTERLWLDVLARYLPKRYSVAPAFVIDSEGRRSRQIDIAIFDNHRKHSVARSRKTKAKTKSIRKATHRRTRSAASRKRAARARRQKKP